VNTLTLLLGWVEGACKLYGVLAREDGHAKKGNDTKDPRDFIL
jgi:hypothetical protein